MVYELTIEGNKDKAVIAFLKQLDFVKIRKVEKISRSKKVGTANNTELPYFGIAPDWDVTAAELRNKSKKRVSGW